MSLISFFSSEISLFNQFLMSLISFCKQSRSCVRSRGVRCCFFEERLQSRCSWPHFRVDEDCGVFWQSRINQNKILQNIERNLAPSCWQHFQTVEMAGVMQQLYQPSERSASFHLFWTVNKQRQGCFN
jgi:hypothetical protein